MCGSPTVPAARPEIVTAREHSGAIAQCLDRLRGA